MVTVVNIIKVTLESNISSIHSRNRLKSDNIHYLLKYTQICENGKTLIEEVIPDIWKNLSFELDLFNESFDLVWMVYSWIWRKIMCE